MLFSLNPAQLFAQAGLLALKVPNVLSKKVAEPLAGCTRLSFVKRATESGFRLFLNKVNVAISLPNQPVLKALALIIVVLVTIVFPSI